MGVLMAAPKSWQRTLHSSHGSGHCTQVMAADTALTSWQRTLHSSHGSRHCTQVMGEDLQMVADETLAWDLAFLL